MANATDQIVGPGDFTFVQGSSFSSLFPGGTALFSPTTFIVKDSVGVPRNNVCLIVYTDGFWYTDPTYSTVITGTGPMNARAVVTNDAGAVILYWSTEILPAANPVTVVAGTPPTYTNGTDQTGQSWIQAYSGSLADTYNVNWTVLGQPGP